MSLTSGTRLGPYEILAPLGAGGMGEVYRARDTRLERDVAVKVLPESVAKDAEHLARLTREARAVAALSHPNILAVHDLGAESGTAYVVLELLDGETLRARLAAGALPQRKALDVAMEIARGLAAAHDKGITHRDLKPENIFVTRGGHVKILDFGLAKQVPLAAGSDTQSPTVPGATEPGTVLGTVGYMSPEQVKGRSADARSDIFSFGAVLYEMLTGRRAFQKETAAETMTAILREEPPDASGGGSHVPPALDRIVRHCLEKDPAERFQSAHDLAFALDAVTGSSATSVVGAPAVAAPRRRAPLLVLAGLAAAFLAGVLADRLAPRTEQAPLVAVRPLTHSGKDADPAVSPDGKTMAFTSFRDGAFRIWLMQLATGNEVALTEGPDMDPRFSPDGSQVLFTRGRPDDALSVAPTTTALYRTAIIGGAPRKVATDAGDSDWSRDGRTIAFVRKIPGEPITSVVLVVSPDGGDPKEIARYPNTILLRPRFSHDGRSVAVVAVPALRNSGARFELVATDGSWKRPLTVPASLGEASGAVWSSSGREILFGQNLAVRFGGSRLVREDVKTSRSTPLLWMPFETFTLESLGDGRLVAASRSTRQNLMETALVGQTSGPTWLTRGTSADRQPVFSPDGEWLAFSSTRSGNLDIWGMSTKTGALRRLTEDPADDWDPGFTRDGKLVWSSSRTGHLEIWMADADGSSPRRVSDDGADAENPASTPDGWIVYASANSKREGTWKVRPDGSGAVRIGDCNNLPEVSPDGLFFTCTDLTSGVVRVLRVADGTALPFRIAPPHPRVTETQIGRPRWSPDGKRIYFLGQDPNGANGVFVQDFDPLRSDTSASRRRVAGFDRNVETESFAISPDGSRIVTADLERSYGIVTIEGVLGIEKR